jgi:hypothetical protein
MSLWEYKIITSGKGGFASPALLEKFLNDLGRDEWEIVAFHAQPDNFLVFTGLARRPTQRDWTLEDAAAAAAKAEAGKLRAEFEAKFKAATSNATPEEPASAFLEEKVAPDDGFRKPIDTSHDADEDEPEKDEDDWDKLSAAQEDELPTFFDAIKPHMRRNQRGPGMSVGVDYLAKKWDQSEEDLKGALIECGFTIPADEDATAEYLEFEGDLYWINVNRRGELWINTKEKPRPVFRAVKGQKAIVEEPPAGKPSGKKHDRSAPSEAPAPAPSRAEAAPAPEAEAGSKSEGAEKQAASASGALPPGSELLDKIRPMMRRNRRGPGGSGSVSFLSRALKCRESDLTAAFKSLGLVVPASANDKPTNVEIGNSIWWINIDSRGNVWINGRDKKPGETVESASASPTEGAGESSSGETDAKAAESIADAVPAREVAADGGSGDAHAAPASTGSSDGTSPLAAVRPLLKQTRTGALAAKLENLAEASGKSVEDLLAQLTGAGLAVPDKPREKPVFVPVAEEIFWLNRNAKGELWLNAKASKFAERKSEEGAGGNAGAESDDADGEKKPRRGRSRKKSE